MSKSSKPQLLRDRQNGFLYFVLNNRRRRILLPEVAALVREKFGGIPIKNASPEQLNALDPGAVVPRDWSDAEWIEPPDNKQMMREIIVSQIAGTGVEFGAGSRPMPVPLSANVMYAEPFQSDDQYARMNYSANTVRPLYSNPIEDQFEIEDGQLDFLVAAHVIEHTPNPVGAIVEAFRTLREGGQLVLVVPDKRRTFDRSREDTALEHLIADYETPDRNRDLENYLDFFRNAKKVGNAKQKARDAHAKGIDVHFHVWTPGSFLKMFRHIQKNIAPFRSIEIKPPVDDKSCLEFYVVAER